MGEKNFQSVVVETLEEVLGKIGAEDANISVRSGRSGLNESFICAVSVNRDDSKLLIGQHGATLSALQHLVQMLAKRKSSEYEGFSIDVNEYWKGKQSLLERDAEEAAHQAIASGRPVHLRPMLSYERKIIHLTLSTNDKVATESFGKGEERKVVVKPAAILS